VRIVTRAVALLFTGLLTLPALAKQDELNATQIAERLTEWDQGYARLRRDIWNLQRANAMFGRDFRGRTLSDDLRDFALTQQTETHFKVQRTLTETQLAKGNTQQATESLLDLYRQLRNELESLDRIGEHRMRHRRVAQQRTLWQQLANAVTNYQAPEAIGRLEQQAVEQLNTGQFEKTSRTTYSALLHEYTNERERLFKSGTSLKGAANQLLIYERRSPCTTTANTNTGKPVPDVASKAKLHYPDSARRAEEEGTVYVQLLASWNGCALRYGIQLSSGWPDLDDAALNWIETIAFVPAAKDGNAVDTWITMPVTFQLND
jgi:TonB family protein